MMMTYFHWGLWSSSWIPRRKGSTSCRNRKCRSQRSYASRLQSHYCTMLIRCRAFCIKMGPESHFCLRRWPQPSYNVRNLFESMGILEHLSLFLVGARVQVLSPRVYTSSSMTDILRVSSTERSWCGCCLQTHLEKTRREKFLFFLQESGSPIPLRDIRAQQPLFDQLVANTGCTGSLDLIACLRAVPFDTLMTAINKSPNIFSFSGARLGWQPSVDGHFIARDPHVSVGKGLFAKVRLRGFSPPCCPDIRLRAFSDRFRLLPATVMMRERMWIETINTFRELTFLAACSLSALPILRRYLYYVPQHCAPLLLTKFIFTNSTNAEFLAYIQT